VHENAFQHLDAYLANKVHIGRRYSGHVLVTRSTGTAEAFRATNGQRQRQSPPE
jgi:hypothetical protein